MDRRRQARVCAVQMLFQIDVGGEDPSHVFPAFWEDRRFGTEVREMAERLVRGTVARRDAIDSLVEESSEHWRLARMPVVDRNILRLAVYEFLCEKTPQIVVIDEAVDLAKRFGGEESGQFVNGLLDSLRKRLEPGLEETLS